MSSFAAALNEQIRREFAASQQYVAIAVWFDAQTLPQLAGHFYRQAVEERNHAMIIVQYLLDSDADVVVPAVDAPQTSFAGAAAAVQLALDQERTVTADIVALVRTARGEDDLVGEQFLHWFLQEQREEVASMSALVAVLERAGDNLLLVEDYLSRVKVTAAEPSTPSPPAAGGAL